MHLLNFNDLKIIFKGTRQIIKDKRNKNRVFLGIGLIIYGLSVGIVGSLNDIINYIVGFMGDKGYNLLCKIAGRDFRLNGVEDLE